eukprot:3403535-Rhodomonas_salina.2
MRCAGLTCDAVTATEIRNAAASCTDADGASGGHSALGSAAGDQGRLLPPAGIPDVVADTAALNFLQSRQY